MLTFMQYSEWTSCKRTQMGMMDTVMSLDQLVDESDPDVDFPNSFHAFQTAEGIRQAHPDKDWFQLVGLIHDVGKTMSLWEEPQWAVVGDTFPVGCKFQNSIVFRDSTFLENPDDKNLRYNTEYGIYEPNCGLENVLMSWGHDAYGDYMHLCNDKDRRMLPWVQEFKPLSCPPVEKLKPYYQSLIDKYCPGILKW
ncbi:Inositol oxygenase [Collichthys lucidus]|uniref:Inositol oxygenase n=1 Tax=Collichthys lucidus TaxID=240159 RepID=A0A4U5UFJ1_COLLU|nr:Inositol oxygenase [Collichthys lucidus]